MLELLTGGGGATGATGAAAALAGAGGASRFGQSENCRLTTETSSALLSIAHAQATAFGFSLLPVRF